MTNYNHKFGKITADQTLEYGPIPLKVTEHHHDEWDEPIFDHETGEPVIDPETGEQKTEHMSRDYDTTRTSLFPTKEEYHVMGYLLLVDKLPSEPAPEGYHYEPRNYALCPDGESYARQYETIANPPPSPRRWSSLAIKRVLEARGSWPEVKGLLESAGLYDDFLMADYIAEDDEAFLDARAKAVKLYGEETVAAILDTIPREA